MLFSYISFISFFSVVFSRELDWFHPIFYSLLLTIYMWLNLSPDLLWPWNFLTNIFLQSLLAYSDSFSNPTCFSVKKKLETLNLKAFSTFNYKCLVFAILIFCMINDSWCTWYKFLSTHKFVSLWCCICSALMYLVTLMNAWGTQEHACPSCLSKSLFWWSSDRSLELPKISSYRKSVN